MQIYIALNKEFFLKYILHSEVVIPEIVVRVEPESWYGHNDAVQSLHKAEYQLRLEFLGVEILVRAENTQLPGHLLGQIVHPVLLIFRQISNGGNQLKFHQ